MSAPRTRRDFLRLAAGAGAVAARGEMTAEDAVAAAESQMQPIFQKWRERGKI